MISNRIVAKQVCPLLDDVINSKGFVETALKILVSNDDGVYADGLWALVKELRE